MPCTGLARPVEPTPGDFDASKGDRFGQAKEREAGLPLRAVDVIDSDPATGTKTAWMKPAASDQSVLPRPAGDAVRPGGTHRPGSDRIRGAVWRTSIVMSISAGTRLQWWTGGSTGIS
jgi:hypothetical protein